jgi:hypothetical protein
MKQLKIRLSLVAMALAAVTIVACSKPAGAPDKEIHTQRAQDVVVMLLNERGELAMGQNQFKLAFRSASNNQPVDAGAVTIASSMAMPGMAPMTAPIELERGAVAGEYTAKGEFGMSGSWKFDVRWEGPAGRGNTTFNASVR